MRLVFAASGVVEVSLNSIEGNLFTLLWEKRTNSSGYYTGVRVGLWMSRNADTWDLPNGSQATQFQLLGK